MEYMPIYGRRRIKNKCSSLEHVVDVDMHEEQSIGCTLLFIIFYLSFVNKVYYDNL